MSPVNPIDGVEILPDDAPAVEVTEQPAWQKIKNRKIRREQEFLHKVDTSVGSRVKMSDDTTYEVTKTGWRKL